ncbi:MAG: Outer membrane protein assembly factor BamD [Candidatus Marinimicrobia bacterium]|nr:Outer membrane protein assembly factor BamD [Candidatus Neomarinimicrobiota bacterium]
MVKRILLLSIAIGVLVACGRQTPTQMWDEARQLSEQENYDEAMSIYKEILAQESLTDTLRAKTTFTMADLYLNHFKKYNTALENYRAVAKNYSGTKWGPKAQFMIGYVYANHLHDYDKAEEEYQAFLDVYPTHELGEAVQFEMTYLGKDLDEIQDLGFLDSAEEQ